MGVRQEHFSWVHCIEQLSQHAPGRREPADALVEYPLVRILRCLVVANDYDATSWGGRQSFLETYTAGDHLRPRRGGQQAGRARKELRLAAPGANRLDSLWKVVSELVRKLRAKQIEWMIAAVRGGPSFRNLPRKRK